MKYKFTLEETINIYKNRWPYFTWKIEDEVLSVTCGDLYVAVKLEGTTDYLEIMDTMVYGLTEGIIRKYHETNNNND